MEVLLTRAPGRVNLIGEHTDHQMGLVFPVCIDLEINAWATPRNDSQFVIHSETLNDRDRFDGSDVKKATGWKNYVRGTVKLFYEHQGAINGANIWITSNIPIGSGLSSSAALEMAIISILEAIQGQRLHDEEAIRLCWRAENEFVGLSCGIMDQFVIRKGRKNHAMLLNCKNLSHKYIKTPQNVSFLVIDTLIPRELTISPYNQRIHELSVARQQLHDAGVQNKHFGDLHPYDFEKISKHISSPYRQRARHVVSENERVRNFQQCFVDGNLEIAGQLLYKSHASLKDDFKASWARADALVDYVKTINGVYGARMTGAGWGGSILMLVDYLPTSSIKKYINRWFVEEFDEKPLIYELTVSTGVSIHHTVIPHQLSEVEEFMSQDIADSAMI